ncbi:hypothetical protein LPB72_02985 [Hydrogenophaga crassostreae]|uniref:AraC-type arabinose-binding/dimerisation domain-containing protein n=1 Tax=Hydrogenophaga crassostreae TaxID=1763535 RepID=A0A162T4T4_9BURK|nr:hypothetical protein LPB072_18050 [Hydrogenophaga crassostreae]OAD43525.1 hypothetical protein LPB72_02985 [Hydrogenophaga crassostreae]
MEVITLRGLRAKLLDLEMGAPQRVDFLLLLLVEQGEGGHVVDFVTHLLHAADVLLVRPGQVQQWRLDAGLEGLLVLVSPSALGPSVGLNSAALRSGAF